MSNVKLPEVKFTKNGYEIRTDVLNIAKELVLSDFNAKYHGWEITQSRDSSTGQILQTVTMPEHPTVEAILAAAEKLYNFVNNPTK